MPEWTRERLIDFEKDIAARFERAEIPYPIHLDGGNEDSLISYFKTNYNDGDWICGTWRMHYKCLLAGVPESVLRHHIMAGRSITLCFPNYNIFSSALVGHSCSIAMGIAYEIKRNNGNEHVHCFVGDMGALTGDFHEAKTYALRHRLPINFVIEDNKKSVTTSTQEVWGHVFHPHPSNPCDVFNLEYEPTWPHQGIGKRVEF